MEASCWQRCLLSLFGCRKRQFLHSSIANPTGTSGARRLGDAGVPLRSSVVGLAAAAPSNSCRQRHRLCSSSQVRLTCSSQTMLNSAVQLIALGHTWPLVIMCTDQYCEEKAPALKATPRRFLFAPLPALFCFSLDSHSVFLQKTRDGPDSIKRLTDLLRCKWTEMSSRWQRRLLGNKNESKLCSWLYCI